MHIRALFRCLVAVRNTTHQEVIQAWQDEGSPLRSRFSAGLVYRHMYNCEQNKKVTIAYIGGGSLNWAPGLMADLAFDTRLAAEVRLYDIDAAAASRNAAMGERFAAVSRGAPARYQVANSLQQALEGADVVVVSILPGRFEDMAQDIQIPASYGIPQSVGDTVGPGGFVRALRAIPMMQEIGRAVAEYAPEAYVCNLSNPMSLLTGALYQAFPAIKCWGECHEVTKLRKQVAWIANQTADPEHPVSHRDVMVNVLGINHFTFVDAIALHGQDMMPAYRAFAQAHSNSGWAAQRPDPEDEHARYFDDRSRVKFDLLRRYGIAGAAGDRHLAEFLPANCYLVDAEDWDFGLTPVDYRVRYQAQKRARAEALVSGETAAEPRQSDEALVDQIVALVCGGSYISNVNLPNKGQMAGLPAGAIVETNAVFSGLGIDAVVAGSLPAELHNIVADHSKRQTQLLQSYAAGDYSALFGLFQSDPLVSVLAVDRARTMYRAMLQATSDYLPAALLKAAS